MSCMPMTRRRSSFSCVSVPGRGNSTAIAVTKGINVAQLVIAWSLTRGDDIVPLIGTSNPTRLAQAIEATRVELTGDDLAAIEGAMPADAVAGERYPQEHMAILGSER